MSNIVLTFPILPGKAEAWRRFCQELAGSRKKRYEESRKRLGITRERLALIETAFGAKSITTLESLDIDRALGQIIVSNDSFDIWYRERLHELHGINLTGYEEFSQPERLPQKQEVLFDWAGSANDMDDR